MTDNTSTRKPMTGPEEVVMEVRGRGTQNDELEETEIRVCSRWRF